MISSYDEAMQEELGAEMGDPRRCERHPHVKTSSNDGLHDAPCHICEGEMEDDAHFHADYVEACRDDGFVGTFEEFKTATQARWEAECSRQAAIEDAARAERAAHLAANGILF